MEAEAEGGQGPPPPGVLAAVVIVVDGSSPIPSGTVEVPEYTLARSAATAAAASVDDSVAVEIDASTRAARRRPAAELERLSAAVCKLRMLFDCCEWGEDELMLAMDSGRGRGCGRWWSLSSRFDAFTFTFEFGSPGRWRVRMMDSLRRITPPSGSRDLPRCGRVVGGAGGGVAPAREMDEFECAGSGDNEVCERLNGASTLYATGGCVGDDAESGGEFAPRSRSKLPCDELAPSPSDAGAAGGGRRVKKRSAGLLPRSAN